MSPPDIRNLSSATEDSRLAVLDGEVGPPDPTNFHMLLGRLEAAREKLPPLYREEVFTPFFTALNELGPTGFSQTLAQDPARNGIAGLILDIAQAILQNGEGFQERATDAFQEVVSDLYDGYLSDADRRGIEPPDRGMVPPLVKWGNPSFGPYTWPVDVTQDLGVGAPIVSLPPAHARLGLLAWAALGHETAGHDILHADTGLRRDLSRAVFDELLNENMGYALALYWSTRIDETASDVLGILNMGPAAGIGLIGYFRGIRAAFTGAPKLSNIGGNGPHPADILRGFLAASTTELLSFSHANAWAEILNAETLRDVSTIRIEGSELSVNAARRSAEIVAQTIVRTRVESLESHALGDIQDWRDNDQQIAEHLQAELMDADRPLGCQGAETYAAHAVAAGVMAALTEGNHIPLILDRMISVLKAMHDANPSWGPLYIRHPGNIWRHRVYGGAA
ncbi:MAG: hypothetical protein NPIRA05_10550 [Nitrospirales bacterium]|nr:MAG: hypothetical protein NPIRA05_10550 [Nitrospirales bacterium]